MWGWVGRARRLPGSPWAFDVLLALGLAAVSVELVREVLRASHLRVPVEVLAYALVLLHTLPVAARRRFPRTVLAVGVGAGLAVAALGVQLVVLGLTPLVLVYSVAAYCDWRASLGGLAAVAAAVALVQVLGWGTGFGTWVVNSLVLAAAWLLGHFVHDRRVYTSELEARTAELERAREELAGRAVVAERLRIARELHDVVAHSMSVVAVQAVMGGHVLDTQPEEARRALAAIETTSRAALEELRRLLGVLREDDEPWGSLTPVPGLADLDALLVQLAEAGLAVKLRVQGSRPHLSPVVDLTAYRIVQEALTNVRKHAGAGRAEVVVCYGDRWVTVEVTDDGRGATAAPGDRQPGTGHGIVGMRERVTLFGGDLEVGPRPGGGFRVAARLPLGAGPR